MNYQATEKLQLNAGVVYNKADDSWDWDFSDRPSLNWSGTKLDQNGDNVVDSTDIAIIEGGSSETNYDTSEQNNLIDTYSDLSYEQYQISLGGTYNFTPTCYTTASVTYDAFSSDEEYVYGDEDGTAYYGYLGFGYRF